MAGTDDSLVDRARHTGQEPMTTGALIFAINNGATDYAALARWNAKNIERHLGIPTHIVTDSETPNKNTRHFTDLGHVAWHNTSRVDAYDLTPWDCTLVLDADYVVATDQLAPLLESDQDFLAHRSAYDVTGCNDFVGLNSFGEHGMPMWWATVMMFRRSNHARLIFEAMRMVRDNWSHYRQLYKIRQATYRNDHALSIALLICDGHSIDHAAIPWSLASVMPEARLARTAPDHYRADFVNSENQLRWITVTQDFHAMGKTQLEAIVASST
jgi:hypothetical protein